MDPEIANSLKEAPIIGKTMFKEFVGNRVEITTKPLSEVIPRANLFTFTNRPPVDLKKGADKLESTKANTALITLLIMSTQARPDADIEEFFNHENQHDPPSLSDQGKLRSGTKSDILSCLPGMPDCGHSQQLKRLL